MHSPVHFGLEDIRVSEEIGNLGPHPALKLWSKEVRTPTLGNADLPSLAGAFVTVDALAEVAYQTPAVFGAEHHSPKPVGALGVSGGIGEVRQPIGRQAVEKNTEIVQEPTTKPELSGTVSSQKGFADLAGSLQACNRYVILTFLSGQEALMYWNPIGFECIWYPTSFELDDANLTDANLTGARLFDADLSRTNLTDARLFGTDLSGTNLTDANLTDADLFGDEMSRANLIGADLSGADLTRADLAYADLTDADLTRADRMVKHVSPSTGQ